MRAFLASFAGSAKNPGLKTQIFPSNNPGFLAERFFWYTEGRNLFLLSSLSFVFSFVTRFALL
jgi:hypothetical protein